MYFGIVYIWVAHPLYVQILVHVQWFMLYWFKGPILCLVLPVWKQTLAINRGESLKILTVKVNIPDRVKSDFSRWCINSRSEMQFKCFQIQKINKYSLYFFFFFFEKGLVEKSLRNLISWLTSLTWLIITCVKLWLAHFFTGGSQK